MCPYSFVEKKGSPHIMDSKLFIKILKDLRDIGTVRLVALMILQLSVYAYVVCKVTEKGISEKVEAKKCLIRV